MDWKGNPWNGKTSTEKGAHPNSRFTAPGQELPPASPPRVREPRRRAHLRHRLRRPPGQDRPPGLPVPGLGTRRVRGLHHGLGDHHAAAAGAVGVVRRDPHGRCPLPFCGYHMADLLAALAGHGRKAGGQGLPRSSTSTGSAPTTRAASSGPASATTCGCWSGSSSAASARRRPRRPPSAGSPSPRTSTWRIPAWIWDTLKGLLNVDKALWQDEVKGIREFYQKFGGKLPGQAF